MVRVYCFYFSVCKTFLRNFNDKISIVQCMKGRKYEDILKNLNIYVINILCEEFEHFSTSYGKISKEL